MHSVNCAPFSSATPNSSIVSITDILIKYIVSLTTVAPNIRLICTVFQLWIMTTDSQKPCACMQKSSLISLVPLLDTCVTRVPRVCVYCRDSTVPFPLLNTRAKEGFKSTSENYSALHTSVTCMPRKGSSLPQRTKVPFPKHKCWKETAVPQWLKQCSAIK